LYLIYFRPIIEITAILGKRSGGSMKYNNLGKSGIKVSELSFGSWVTFANQLDLGAAKECLHSAFELGVNFFDNAETYAHGQSELLMGKAIKDLRREDLVISTKIFWGGQGPNDTGLSWKHLIEGTKNALKRLDLEYVDLIFCHRPDHSTPIEETVRAMDNIVRRGWAFYWGTSEWSAEQITSAYELAEMYGCVPRTMEQPQYNMLERDRVEKEYALLYKNFGIGTTRWSPLASGALCGKYNNGVPKEASKERTQWAERYLSEKNLAVLKQIEKIAQNLDCTMAQLALAWCLKNPNVSTVITGATSVKQIQENMKAADIKDKLTNEVMAEIAKVLSTTE